MAYKVDNAIIMAAGTASRFAPLSYEKPKALFDVKGEVLIERQIRQLKEAGIQQVFLVTGYMKEQFDYLKEKYGVIILENKEYLSRNNNSSIWAAKDYIRNSYICSSDNYFSENPFETEVDDAYYAAVYADGNTAEWCIKAGVDGYIDSVSIGGSDSWFMLGHTFWSEDFSRNFLEILAKTYDEPETATMLWEAIYMEHLDVLKMKIRKYNSDVIFEFDTLDELRNFDESYVENSRSAILKSLAERLDCEEADLVNVLSYKTKDNAAAGIRFNAKGKSYQYSYEDESLIVI